MRFHVYLLPFVAAGLGCVSASMATKRTELIQTDSPIYTVEETGGLARVTIRIAYHNTSDQPVFLPSCQGPHPPRLQKQVGDEWVMAYSPNVLACQGTPLTIAAGESYNYVFEVVAGMPGTNYSPRFNVPEVPGTYRVVWEIFHGAVGNETTPVITRDPLPLQQEYSNAFELVR